MCYMVIIPITDLTGFDNSYCQDDGTQRALMIRSAKLDDNSTHYELPQISVIPPYEEACYINLHYNGNVLEETFYIFKDRTMLSEKQNWKIMNWEINLGPMARDLYTIYKPTSAMEENEIGKKLRSTDISKIELSKYDR